MNTLRQLSAAGFAACCVTIAAWAAEVSPAGTWKWTVSGPSGGQSFEQTLSLDYKDGELTGTLMGFRQGELQLPDTPITHASFSDGTIRFAVTRELNGNKFTTNYEGRVDGNSIKGASERPGLEGGEPVKREWHAYRVK